MSTIPATPIEKVPARTPAPHTAEDIITGRTTQCLVCGEIIAEVIDPYSGCIDWSSTQDEVKIDGDFGCQGLVYFDEDMDEGSPSHVPPTPLPLMGTDTFPGDPLPTNADEDDDTRRLRIGLMLDGDLTDERRLLLIRMVNKYEYSNDEARSFIHAILTWPG